MVVNTTHDVLELLKPYQETYVDVLQTRVHLYHKSGDTRTSNLGVLSVSSIRTKELEVNAVINHFAANHNNRRIVLLWLVSRPLGYNYNL